MASFKRSPKLSSKRRSSQPWRRHSSGPRNMHFKVLPYISSSLYSKANSELVISDFFPAYPHSLDSDAFRRILTPTLNCAKSANITVRIASLTLFKVVVEKKASDESKEHTVTELLNFAKAGKSVGPDRQILYSMLGYLSPSEAVSKAMVATVPALLAKETNDTAAPVLGLALTPHLAYQLRESIPIPADVTSILAKEMQSSKPVIRRTFVSLVGDALWQLGTLPTNESKAFAKTVIGAFDASLKVVVANPSAGPVEGYVAISVLLGPFAKSGAFGTSCDFFLFDFLY